MASGGSNPSPSEKNKGILEMEVKEVLPAKNWRVRRRRKNRYAERHRGFESYPLRQFFTLGGGSYPLHRYLRIPILYIRLTNHVYLNADR